MSPESLRPSIEQGVAALGLSPEPGLIEPLVNYVGLLDRWNQAYNLTAIRDLPSVVTHHLLDCLAIVRPIERQTAGASLSILDVGSGGGLPGIVLAICRPDWTVSCVDAVGKKAAFVQQAIGALGLKNLHALHSRVEQLARSDPREPRMRFDLVTARAFATLADLVRLTDPLLAPSGAWAAMKGVDPVAERRALPPSVDVFHVEPLRVPGLDAQRCLVWMRRRAAAVAAS